MANIHMIRDRKTSQLVLDRVPVAGDFIRVTRYETVKVARVGLIPGGDRDADVVVEKVSQDPGFGDTALDG